MSVRVRDLQGALTGALALQLRGMQVGWGAAAAG